MRWPRALTSLALVCALVAGACTPAPGSEPRPTATGERVTIGVEAEGETQLLGQVMRRLLAAAGIRARLEELDDGAAIRQALELGAVDVAVGYTGEAWLQALGRPDPPGDARTSFREVARADAERGLIWLRPRFARAPSPARPPADATFAFFVQGAPLAGAPSLATMSEFAARVSADPSARVCVDDEFGTRPDGLRRLWRSYSVDPDRGYFPAGPREALRGVAAGGCLAGLASATSGEAWRLNLQPLIDDRQVFPAFVVTPVVAEEATAEHPGLPGALRPLADTLTTEMLGQWNARVASGAPVEKVARAAAEVVLAAAEAATADPEGDG